jgi:hypothetical protein
MSNPLAGIADVTDVVKNTVIAHPSDDDDVSAGRIMALLPRATTLRVVLPNHTPMIDVAAALTQLAWAVNGSWRWDPASSAFVVEGQP